MVSKYRIPRQSYRELLFGTRHKAGRLKLRRRGSVSQKAEETRVNRNESCSRSRQCHKPATYSSEGHSTASSISFHAVTTLPSHLLVAPIDRYLALAQSQRLFPQSPLFSSSFLESLLAVLIVVSIVHLSSSFLQDPASFFIEDILRGLPAGEDS